MRSTIDRFDLIESIAERIYLRMSSQVAGVVATHEMWVAAYDMFKTGNADLPMIELSLDLAREVLSLVEDNTGRN